MSVDTRGWNINTHSRVGYSPGCRCDTCRADRAEDVRNRRAAASARRIAAEVEGRVYIASGVRHGTRSAYKNSSCRCPECCRAEQDYKRGVYVSPLSAQPAPVPPGCIHCKGAPSTGPCCSSHNARLCHRCYRRTHFVERCHAGCERCVREGLDPTKWPAPAARIGGAS
jgi:hypothetical protein